jgi:serine/threonine protein kinase
MPMTRTRRSPASSFPCRHDDVDDDAPPPLTPSVSSLPELQTMLYRGSYEPIPGVYSKELRDTISHMLTVNPAERPSAA